MLQPANQNEDLVTFEEFCQVIQDGQKADLIDGVVYMASPDTFEANDINGFLWSLLRMYNSAKNLGGTVLGSRYACRIDALNAREPDVVYVSLTRRALADRLGFQGGPDVVIEIVSRDSRHRDYHLKRDLYEDAGVTEYWIVDPRERMFTALHLEHEKFAEMPISSDGVLRSQAIAGFWLRVNWLFETPLPDDYTVLQTILAGPPASE